MNIQKKHNLSLAKNTFIVASITLLSRILGFLRDLCLAIILGAGPEADAFFVAFRIPNLLRRLFAEGSLSMAFIPVFTKTNSKYGKDKAFLVARSLQLWLLIILGFIVTIGIIWASPLVGVIAPGFKDKPEIFNLTVNLTRICLPYIIFISSVALYMGILNSFEHFFFPALAPCILNITLIGAALIGYFFKFPISYSLAIGVFFAGVLQALSQFPILKKHGFSLKGPINLFSEELKKIFFLILPTIFGAAIYQINILLTTLLASFLPQGSISYLYYADRLVQFPLGIFGIAIGTVALPSFSLLLAQKKWREVEKSLSLAINLNLFIILPAVAGLIGFSNPIIKLLFGHGSFTEQAVTSTAYALIAYAVGLPAFSLTKTLVSTFYAFEDTKTPVYSAFLSLILNISLGFLLMQYIQHIGLALAVSIASWANIVFLIHKLRQKLNFSFDLKEISISFFLSLAILLIAHCLRKFSLWALTTIPLIAINYLIISYFLKANSARLIVSTFIQNIFKER
ncbi:murein biosynthesis integral membrane protein MurJ [Desulfonauticus submarinus]